MNEDVMRLTGLDKVKPFQRAIIAARPRPGYKIIYRGGHHYVECNGVEHFQVIPELKERRKDGRCRCDGKRYLGFGGWRH